MKQYNLIEGLEKDAQEARLRRAYIAERVTEKLLSILEEQFQTNLPCFQGEPGKYDPFDAMKRDAQREVVLWLRLQIQKHKQDINND